MKFFTKNIATVAAGKTANFPLSGNLFVVIDASHDFKVQFNSQEMSDCKAGVKVDFAEAGMPDGFKQINIHNPHASLVLTVEFWTASAGVDYQYLRARSTKLRGKSFTLASALDTFVFPGVATVGDTAYSLRGIAPGSRRHSFAVTVSNTDATKRVQVLDSLNEPITTVFGGAQGGTFSRETDADLTVRAVVGGVDCQVCETFYV